jgi:hypothetical protein
VPGTELTPERRADLVRQLTIAGWLLLAGPVGFIAFQLERVRSVGEQRFATVWDQRIEVLSFTVLPPNLVVIAPMVFATVVAVWLAGAQRDPWLVTLLRIAAGLPITLAVIGIVSVISIIVREDSGPSDVEGIMLRLGGIVMAAGFAACCRIADRFPTGAP